MDGDWEGWIIFNSGISSLSESKYFNIAVDKRYWRCWMDLVVPVSVEWGIKLVTPIRSV